MTDRPDLASWNSFILVSKELPTLVSQDKDFIVRLSLLYELILKDYNGLLQLLQDFFLFNIEKDAALHFKKFFIKYMEYQLKKDDVVFYGGNLTRDCESSLGSKNRKTTIDQEQATKLEKIIKTLDSFQHSRNEIVQWLDRFVKKMSAKISENRIDEAEKIKLDFMKESEEIRLFSRVSGFVKELELIIANIASPVQISEARSEILKRSKGVVKSGNERDLRKHEQKKVVSIGRKGFEVNLKRMKINKKYPILFENSMYEAMKNHDGELELFEIKDE
jgi:hypothetical protein